MEGVKLVGYSLIEKIELAKGGDKQAFSEIVEEVKIKLYKTGMSILKNDEDTCDAIQETLISAYKNLNTLKNDQYFSTWIIRIMINKCYDIIKNNKKIAYLNEKVQVEENTYYEMYSQKSELEWVINNIEEELKMVTVLYYYDDLPISEISQILNIPEGTVKSRLSRAREKIYDMLKERGGEVNG